MSCEHSHIKCIATVEHGRNTDSAKRPIRQKKKTVSCERALIIKRNCLLSADTSGLVSEYSRKYRASQITRRSNFKPRLHCLRIVLLCRRLDFKQSEHEFIMPKKSDCKNEIVSLKKEFHKRGKFTVVNP